MLGSDPRRLLERAAQDFLVVPPGTPEAPFPTPSYLLVLRQGGVRDDLIEIARERGVTGWVDPPLCTFDELPHRFGETTRKPLGEFERAALLSSVLQSSVGAEGGPAARLIEFGHWVERWFGELVAEGVTADAYDRAIASGGRGGAFELERDTGLGRAYRAYLEAMESLGRRDGRDRLVDCADAVRADAGALAKRLSGRREIRIFGLHDLRGGWRYLLRALLASPAIDRVILYGTDALDLGFEASVERLDEPATPGSRLFAVGGRPADTLDLFDRFELITAPDVERELEEVARRARKLIDGGVAPDRIAIVSRQARPYTDLTLRCLEKFGVPATARRRVAYQEIPVVRATLSLFAAAAEGWSRHALVELAEQPYFAHDLDARVLNYVGFRTRVLGLDAWEAQLDSLEREARRRWGRGDLTDDPAAPPKPDVVSGAREAFARFAARARPLDAERRLADWLAWLREFATDDPWGVAARIYAVPDARYDLARLDLLGWSGLNDITAEWADACSEWQPDGGALSVAQFHGLLREMLSGSAALWTATARGVRVLEALAAAYRSFDHVFLVGMSSGTFPVHAPTSPILDEGDREALSQNGVLVDRRGDWDARERTLFRVLVAGARQVLTLSSPQLDLAGEEVSGSVFTEALAEVASPGRPEAGLDSIFTPDLPVYTSETVAAHAVEVARIERVRETGELTAYNGLIEDPGLRAWLASTFGDEHRWSPTQIEAHAKCPWAHFSARLLGVRKAEDPDEEMDALTRGSVLHEALRRFYEGAAERSGGAPVFLRESDLDWALPALGAALERALEVAETERWVGHPALRDAKRLELERILTHYLQWEVNRHEALEDPRKQGKTYSTLRTGVSEHEVVFDAEQVALERSGIRVRYRGRIDRIERSIDKRVQSPHISAIDYKTSKDSAPGGGDKQAWEDGVVLQLPLYVHALTQLRPDTTVAGAEYHALRQQERVHPLLLRHVESLNPDTAVDPDTVERMESALDAVIDRVRRIRAGEFPAHPAPSCLCPPFCHAWDICRVAGGPRTKREKRWP